MNAADLRRRITDRSARLCVVGQGYVGLSLAIAAASDGFEVDAIDVDAERIAGLAAGSNVVPGVIDETFDAAFATGRLHFGTDAVVAEGADVVVVCVPTPVVEHRPDLSAIESAGRALGKVLTADTLVVLESTTYPGTTEQVFKPLLEDGGLKAGRDFLLAYSPERIDPGNTVYGLRNTPRVVGGITPASSKTAAHFYGQLVDDVTSLSSCRAAEMAKLLENTYRMVNIALVNELAMLCAEQGIDSWEVIAAAATKPFGFMPFYPGPGVGGHCIPLDPTYLAWQSRRDTGKPFRLVELAQDINAQMPTYVAGRVVDVLNDHNKSLNGAKVFVLGVTYKPNVGDLRESAALEVIEQIRRRGAKVSYHDPFVASIATDAGVLRRSRLTHSALESADIVLLLTPHDSYDLQWVTEAAPLLFDARNAIGRPSPASVVYL